jgi:hypothetical protein
MKRFSLLILLVSATLGGVAMLSSVARADPPVMTEDHITQIRNNCVEAQSSLNQLHASDALLRVNRGQIYESISTKLMLPLNSRIAQSRLDGLHLVSIAADYERQLADFRLSYQQYEESMSNTLAIDCVKQPVAFYDSVTATRDKRKLTHDATVTLEATIQNYSTEFEAFAAKFQGNAK